MVDSKKSRWGILQQLYIITVIIILKLTDENSDACGYAGSASVQT